LAHTVLTVYPVSWSKKYGTLNKVDTDVDMRMDNEIPCKAWPDHKAVGVQDVLILGRIDYKREMILKIFDNGLAISIIANIADITEPDALESIMS